MSVTFNGRVTINGNVEMYDNGSTRITGNQVSVSVGELAEFIEKELPYSTNKEEYKEAARVLASSPQDKDIIKKAFIKIGDFVKETGKLIWISGLSGLVQEVAKEIAKRVS